MLSKVKATNFQSWGTLEFNITSGVTLVDGWNEDDQTSEGSGKSAILNAISWCIYGKLPKDVNIDDVIKRGESSCAVELEFSDGTTIMRSRKPNDLLIKSDKQVFKGKDARETQQLIQDYVGRSFESFCQSSYFAQNYAKKFLLSNQEEKGKVLSDIQEISVFDKARKEVQDLAKIESDKVTTLDNQIKMEQSKLSNIKSQKIMIESFMRDKMASHQKLIQDLQFKKSSVDMSIAKDQQKIQELQSSIAGIDLNVIMQKAHELQSQHTKLSMEYGSVSQKYSQLKDLNKSILAKEQEGNRYASRYKSLSSKKESLETYISNPTKNCPTCKSLLSNCDVSHAQKELEEIQSDMDQIVQMLESISQFLDNTKVETDAEVVGQLQVIQEKLNQVNAFTKANRGDHDNFNFVQNSIQNLNSQISHYAKLSLEYETSMSSQKEPDLAKEGQQLSALMQEENSVENKIVQLQIIESQTKTYLTQLETLKDGFKEIKSYVFNTALNELSFRANQFLTTLFQVPAKISFVNEDLKIETKIILNEEETSIGLLSGGQFRRFSLAVDLALSDMVSSRKNSKLGILILDEYFKDLSEASMEKCLDLLKLRKSPVLLIEHNSIFKNIVDNTFFVRLEKGTSSESRE